MQLDLFQSNKLFGRRMNSFNYLTTRTLTNYFEFNEILEFNLNSSQIFVSFDSR